MIYKQLIIFCLVSATLCACKSKTDNTTAEPPASQQQAVQATEDNTPRCGDTTCKADETCTDNLCKPASEQTDTNENQQPSDDGNDSDNSDDSDDGDDSDDMSDEDKPPVQCGEKICQYKEECKDNQCKTRFEMDIYLAPVPKEGIVKNDSYDYWECQSDTCTYQADQTYTIKKGIRVREDKAYCGGEGLPLSKMKEHTCTNKGWVCASPDGCGECLTTDCHYSGCKIVSCSPGEKCAGNDCRFVNGAIENVFLCKDGNCECGKNRCGKNQICAYGDCYLAGKKRNGFADCEFEVYSNFCGSSDTPEQIIRYICPKRCLSEIPPKEEDGYSHDTIELGDCDRAHFDLWICENEEGCKCGNKICPERTACIDGRCALFTNDSFDDFTIYYDASTCAIDFLDKLTYQPKKADHYQIAELGDSNDMSYWMCDDSNECICNGQKLPAGMICHGEINGTEYIACSPEKGDHKIHRAPKNITNYICRDNRWVCANDKCVCGGKPLPRNAYCKDDVIWCGDIEKPSDITGYGCNNDQWFCRAEKCLCGSNEILNGMKCRHWNGKDYPCCGDSCLSTQTASEYECVNSEWVAKSEVDQRHCGNKLLPAGARCVGDWNENPDDTISYIESAYCGEEQLLEWGDYKCEDNTWKCALKDKLCMCNGKPLPPGARCIKNEAYCGSSSRSNWDDDGCLNNEWKDGANSDLCFGHKLKSGVQCPPYDIHDMKFTDDITMSDMESCEHVRGCLCHDKLCPPSGICTADGCIDPLTDKPFESKDDYLVSDKLRQCAKKDGCKCGDKSIEYRDYCYRDEQYISMISCVSDNKRTIGENNFATCACEGGYGCETRDHNACKPEPYIDPSQYLVRDCLSSDPAYFSDRSVDHTPMNVCMEKEGCQCIHNTCKYGEACYKGQCIPDYPCHNVSFEDNEDQIGKCRPTKEAEEDDE